MKSALSGSIKPKRNNIMTNTEILREMEEDLDNQIMTELKKLVVEVTNLALLSKDQKRRVDLQQNQIDNLIARLSGLESVVKRLRDVENSRMTPMAEQSP